jgi:hypothetical protein
MTFRAPCALRSHSAGAGPRIRRWVMGDVPLDHQRRCEQWRAARFVRPASPVPPQRPPLDKQCQQLKAKDKPASLSRRARRLSLQAERGTKTHCPCMTLRRPLVRAWSEGRESADRCGGSAWTKSCAQRKPRPGGSWDKGGVLGGAPWRTTRRHYARTDLEDT